MPSGKLGSARLAAATNTVIGSAIGAGKIFTANVSIVNCGALGAKVRLAIATTASPADADWIEYDAIVPPSGGIERSALVLSAGEQIVAYSDVAGVTVRAHGMERSA